jgi:hypothetical protein
MAVSFEPDFATQNHHENREPRRQRQESKCAIRAEIVGVILREADGATAWTMGRDPPGSITSVRRISRMHPACQISSAIRGVLLERQAVGNLARGMLGRESARLVRPCVSEPFHSLSVGAREQIAMIMRLALADILRASGQPDAIILDDALVNTDEGRQDEVHPLQAWPTLQRALGQEIP